MADSENGEL